MYSDIIEHNERVLVKRKKGWTLFKLLAVTYAVIMAYLAISTLYYSIIIIYK
jgi:uncharacterized membrane protein